MVEQGFKFLNSFGFSLEYQKVFSGRNSNKIDGSVIAGNSIEMVNMPTIGNRFSLCLFPNQNVLQNIMALACTGVVWLINPNVAPTIFNPAPLPVVRLITSWHNSMFSAMGIFISNRQATNWARVFMRFLPNATSLSGLFSMCSPPFMLGFSGSLSTLFHYFVRHNTMIAYCQKFVNVDSDFLPEKIGVPNENQQ